MPQRHLPQRLVVLVTLLLLAFWLRVTGLANSPFRGDEAYTIQYWMQQPLATAFRTVITLDPQPPLAYALFNAWGQVAGVGEFAARYLPVLFGVLGVAVMYRLARRLFGGEGGTFAALLWAIHPFLVWHSQDARNYAPWSTLSLLALWLALRALQRNRPRDYALYGVAALAAAYTYYLDVFAWVVLAAYALVVYWRDWRRWQRITLTWAACFALLLPWYAYLYSQLQVSQAYGGTTGGFDIARLFTEFPAVLNLGYGASLPRALLLGMALLLPLAVLVVGRRRWLVLPVLLAVIPSLLLSVVATRLNVFAPRYVLLSAPAYVLTVAGAWAFLREWFPGSALAYVPVALLPYLFAQSLLAFNATNTTKAPDWPALTDYLEARAAPDDLIIQAAADAAFGYYYDGAADERAIPGQPDQPASDIEAELSSVSTQYSTLWLAAQGFTDWPNYGVTEAWLAANMQLVRNTQVAGLRAQQYAPWDVREVPSDAPALATFTDVADLVAVRAFPPEPTGEQIVWLVWRPLAQTAAPLTVFVHRTAPDGFVLSQDDQPPQDGRAATPLWQPGTLYRDVYALPNAAALPTDGTRLAIGLYDPATGARVPTDDGTDAYMTTPD